MGAELRAIRVAAEGWAEVQSRVPVRAGIVYVQNVVIRRVTKLGSGVWISPAQSVELQWRVISL